MILKASTEDKKIKQFSKDFLSSYGAPQVLCLKCIYMQFFNKLLKNYFYR